jgi:hypothetical protein
MHYREIGVKENDSITPLQGFFIFVITFPRLCRGLFLSRPVGAFQFVVLKRNLRERRISRKDR